MWMGPTVPVMPPKIVYPGPPIVRFSCGPPIVMVGTLMGPKLPAMPAPLRVTGSWGTVNGAVVMSNVPPVIVRCNGIRMPKSTGIWSM
ncbi:hypothetical protein MYIN104542_30405 [Mycobacterium intermedium]